MIKFSGANLGDGNAIPIKMVFRNSPGDYFVTRTDSCGLVTSNHIIVTANVAFVAPVITAVGFISLFAGGSVTLLGNVGGVWNTGATTTSITVTTAGDYFVTKTDSCGTVTSNHIIVTVNSGTGALLITASGPVLLCLGDSVTLTGNVGGVWNTGALTASITVKTAGDYFVTKTDSNGTVTSNHIIVTIHPSSTAPVITATSSIVLCAGASVTLLGRNIHL